MSKKRTKNSAGLLDYKVHVSQFHEKYYLEPSQSDVILVIEGKKVPAHRLIISAESEFFKALLYGNYAERNQSEVAIQEVSYSAFLLILQYMYSMIIDLADENLDVVLKAFELTRRFGLQQLEDGFEEYLISILSIENVLKIFPMAKLLNVEQLLDEIFLYTDKNEEVLAQEDFLKLKSVDACTILSRKREFLNEVFVFRRVQKWIETNPGNLDILKCIDFSRLAMSQITQVVQPSNLFDASFLLQMLRSKGFELKSVTNCQNPEYFQTTGECYSRVNLLRMSDRYVLYGFIVELNAQNLINNVQMKIEMFKGYKVEVSTDQEKWIEVLDYKGFWCDDLQDLYFPEVEAKFIRISGERLPNFDFNSFKVFHSTTLPNMKEGFLCPASNDDINGTVYEEEEHMQDDKFKKIWNELKEDGQKTPCITEPKVCFNQPMYVNTIRFRLWDYDGRKQAYKVTIAGKQPERLLKESDEEVDGWQVIKFPATALVEIKINGKGKNIDNVRVAFFETFYDESL